MTDFLHPAEVARNFRAERSIGILRRNKDNVASSTLSRALIDPVTGMIAAYIDAAGNLVGPDATPLFPKGQAVVQHANGTSTSYLAAADSDTARGDALVAARAAAIAGERIYVGPGNYSVTASLAKHRVDWDFASNSFVSWIETGASSRTGIWDDGGAAMTFNVTGHGTFLRSADTDSAQEDHTSTIACRHADSIISVDCLDITCSVGTNGAAIAINCEGGRLSVRCRRATGLGEAGTGAWWSDGFMDASGEKLYGSGYGFWMFVNAPPTADAHIRFSEIEANQNAVFDSGGEATAAAWVRANIIKVTDTPAAPAITMSGSSKLYVECQKVIGPIWLFGNGLLYVRADKISPADPSLDHLYASDAGSTGYARISITQWECVGNSGASITLAGGTTELIGGRFIGSAASNGISISGGTAYIDGMRIDTQANTSTDPFTKSGGTLIFDGGRSTLLAGTGRNSISAPTAQDVKNYSRYATNKAKHANVTLQVEATELVDVNVT